MKNEYISIQLRVEERTKSKKKIPKRFFFSCRGSSASTESTKQEESAGDAPEFEYGRYVLVSLVFHLTWGK